MATLIKPDGSETEYLPANGTRFTYEELSAAVGGMIERLVLPTGQDVYLNEEGKLLGLPRNARATTLCRGTGIAPTDYVVGNLLVLTTAETQASEEDEEDE